MNKFKGGPVVQNSGGSDPDDYLIKLVSGGRWTLVLFRWGHHFGQDGFGGDKVGLEQAKVSMLADKEAMKEIFPLRQICTSDNARRLAMMKKRGVVPTMFASDFLEKYGTG